MPRLLAVSLLAAAAAALAAPAATLAADPPVAPALPSVPGPAPAADVLVAPDPLAQQIAALDGTVVWVSGRFGHQTLMQRTPDGTIAAVKGAPLSRSYSSIDLGHNSDGRLLLTYLRCDAGAACKALWNDLDGRRATFRKLTPPGCTVSTAPAQWRTRVAYGLSCTGSVTSRKRTGLYIKNGSRPPVRLPRPHDAVKYGVMNVQSVDLRATRVAAVAADIYTYAFSETTAGKGMSSFLAAASEGDSDERSPGLALGSRNDMWSLTDASHAGDPNEATIFRTEPTGCESRERLVSAAESDDFLATDLAVDGRTVYLLVPGEGVVTHAFAPSEGVCS
ncbi:MAG TPA: hypothetical protein VHZ75_00175 [Solirubrobacteraceae bacterium]|nr:hypothetical protein [Solirubrobacteraceae bacterium]